MAKYGLHGLPSLGNLKTPLEGIDLVADGINRVFTLPAEVAGKVTGAVGKAFNNLESDIEQPREQAERPIPPDVLIKPAFSGLGHIVEGVIDTAKSAVDGVVGNVEGARQELEQFIRG